MNPTERPPELSILIPAKNARDRLSGLLPGLRGVLATSGVSSEIVVLDLGSTDDTCELAEDAGARVFSCPGIGYGRSLQEGARYARGTWLATIGPDLSHDPGFLLSLLRKRHEADILIASRYVPFGHAQMGFVRRVVSRLLNNLSARILSLPYQDVSSEFRLYHRRVFEELSFAGEDYSILLEVLVKAHCEGFRILEVPFHYYPRAGRRLAMRHVHYGLDSLRTMLRLWKLRNSVFSADYDARGFHSNIPPQRYWQRKRYELLRDLLDSGSDVLDIGCGSSMVMVSMPGAVGMDIQHKKLRYLRQLGLSLVTGTLQYLPFRDATFSQVVCSQVIEHVPRERISFEEMSRVLKPGGTLILGTPDYGRIWWPITEWLYGKLMPGGYADEHITHFTHDSLAKEVEALGYQLEATRYILGGEMIQKFRKLEGPPPIQFL